jgi:leader peptidase (prepilin peptidase)/N-methyltransferase
MQILLITELVFIFLLGASAGSFLNVCICRLPYEKSIFWPGSRCGHCFQPIRLRHNIPLLSYWLLRGRCRSCGVPFSIRYFFIELLTGLAFVGLFYLEIVQNIHNLPGLREDRFGIKLGLIPLPAWFFFAYHAALLFFLIAAAVIDIDHQEIPLSLTVTGTFVGLVGGTLLWPWQPAVARWKQVTPPAPPAIIPDVTIQPGVYSWPVWVQDDLPAWLAPDSRWTGLVTGLAGMVAGMLVLRMIGFLFQLGRGKEGMGLGDADFMMMAGSFLGWQPVVMAFFLSVFPGLVYGILQFVVRRDQALPFGPSLATGVLLALLGWQVIGPQVRLVFFSDSLLLWLTGIGAVLLLLMSGFLRALSRHPEAPAEGGQTAD